MKKAWQKLGLVYAVRSDHAHPKLLSHAANPLPVQLEGNIYRVFFNSRDYQNRSSIGAVDIDMNSLEVVRDHFSPFFEHGPAGSFFAEGVSLGNAYYDRGTCYITFMGWQQPTHDHWRGTLGRLILTHDFRLEPTSTQPFFDVDSTDPISMSYPWVQARASGGFDMWYGSTLTWRAANGEMIHVLHHAYSADGDHWQRNGLAVPYQLGKAQAFSRPSVLRNDDGSMEMWFSYRGGGGDTYRIGHATSQTGLNWILDLEESGIDISDQGWDSEMIAYPFVLTYSGARYMFYNGNGFGRSGFGVAVMSR
jgi:hypothetical protein